MCRPSHPAAYTGTVILEWLNVSVGFDAPAHWMLTHRQVVRAGWAWVDVPVAALSGLTPPGATGIGILFGSTRVFDAAELARRYPAGPGAYAAAFREITMRAAAAGFVLEQDVDEMVAVAAAAYPDGRTGVRS